MNQLLQWLDAELEKRNLKARVHSSLIRQDGQWYYVPVYVDIRDAYDKATILQEIEDDWEEQQVQPGQNLLLIPAAN